MPKPKLIKDPNELIELWEKYKAQVGYDEIEHLSNKGEIVTLRVKNPLLKQGFEAFAFRELGFGIGQYLDNQDKRYNEYVDVITCIRREWETNQINGTMTGKYKAANLTARLNGFTEKQDITSNGKDIGDIKVNIVKSGDK